MFGRLVFRNDIFVENIKNILKTQFTTSTFSLLSCSLIRGEKMKDVEKQRIDKIEEKLNLLTFDELKDVSAYVEKFYTQCNQEHHQALSRKD